MPAEWERHAATWMAWPHSRGDWPGKFAPIPWVYGEIVRALSRHEPVCILVPDAEVNARAARVLKAVGADTGRVSLHVAPTNRSWVRDSGPIFVHGAGGVTALDWGFTAWAKYDDWQTDDAVPAAVAGFAGTARAVPTRHGKPVVLEGGGVDVNGAGLLLTTEEWLLSDEQVRNPGYGRADYESLFAQYLGAEEVVWLGDGIVGDDTHGHVDDLARFVDESTVVLAQESDEADANFARLRDNRERLEGFRTRRGAKLAVVPLPMPRAVVFRGQRLPASYANFYVANGVVIVPTFNDPADRVALGTLAELFPGRAVVGVHAVDLVWGLGTLHCLSQQQPAARGGG